MKKLIFVLSYLLLVVPCQAGTITVDDDGPADFNNIQAAINDANNSDHNVHKGRNYLNKTENYDIILYNK